MKHLVLQGLHLVLLGLHLVGHPRSFWMKVHVALFKVIYGPLGVYAWRYASVDVRTSSIIKQYFPTRSWLAFCHLRDVLTSKHFPSYSKESYPLGWTMRDWIPTMTSIRHCVNWWQGVGRSMLCIDLHVRLFWEYLKESLLYDNRMVPA
jgi:hypothetical protein